MAASGGQHGFAARLRPFDHHAFSINADNMAIRKLR